MVAACIKRGLFHKAQFKRTFALERRWQKHNTEKRYVQYLDALVGEFILAINGVQVADFNEASAKMIRHHRVRRFGFATDLRLYTQHSHTFIGTSGSPSIIVEPFLADLVPDYVFGSQIAVKDGVFTDAQGVGKKDEIINRLVAQGAVLLNGSVAVGDTIGDAPMLSLVDVPIMFNPSKTLRKHGTQLGWHWVTETKDNITYLQPGTEPGDYRVRPIDVLYDKIADLSSQTV